MRHRLFTFILAIRRSAARLALVVSLLLCPAALSGWAATALGWRHWTALQGPHASFVAYASVGELTLSIASISPDPDRPATMGWQCFGGRGLLDTGGSVARSGGWFDTGMIRPLGRIPYSDGVLDNNVMSLTIEAVGVTFAVPLWLISAVGAVLPLRSVYRRLVERKRRSLMMQGRCPSCGYDLRASPGRCPECGAVPSK